MSPINLDRRTKILFIFLILSVISSFLFKSVYKPQQTKKAELRRELKILKNKAFKLKTRMPDVRVEDLALAKEKNSLGKLKAELRNLEEQLPRKDNLPGLLGGLLKQSKGYAISFNLIKPLKKEEEFEYQQFNMEMQFGVTYKNLINYLYHLEKSLPFIRISHLVVDNKEKEKEKEMEDGSLNVSMILSTLLVEGSKSTIDFKKLGSLTPAPSRETLRDPFFSQFMPRQVDIVMDEEYMLSGITSQGKYPTAIINNEVYKIGDWIGESQIQTITQDKVVLKNGEKMNTLVIQEDDK